MVSSSRSADSLSGSAALGKRQAAQKTVIKQYQLESQVGFLLRRAHQFASSIFSSTIPDANLTPPQFSVLVKLAELGQVSQNQLGRLVDIDQSTVQGIVSRLRQRGLVTRTEDPLHKSRLLLGVTDEGRQTLTVCIPAAGKVSKQTLASLTAAERRELRRLLNKMVNS